MLAIIQGNAGLINARNDESDRFIDQILHATQRRAELAMRLLAFSRRQTLNPQPLDVSELAQRMTPLLQRTL